MSKDFWGRAIVLAQAVAWWGALFGGVLLFAHFYSISYLPRFDLASLMGTIAGVAGLGFLLLMSLGLLLILPGGALQLGDDAGVIRRMPRRRAGKHDSRQRVLMRKHTAGAWLLGSLLASAILIVIIKTKSIELYFSIVIWAALGVWFTLWIAAEVFQKTPLKRRYAGTVFYFFLTFILFGSLSFVVLFTMGATTDQASWAHLAVTLGVVLMSQFSVYFTQGQPLRYRAVMVGAVALIFTLMTSVSSMYSSSISSFFRLGMMQGVNLIVTERACEMLAAASSTNIACLDGVDGQGVRSTGPVDVWTRIGADALLSPAGSLNCVKCARVLLPNQEILAIELDPAAPGRTSQDAGRVHNIRTPQ